jgi:hypothetical protein
MRRLSSVVGASAFAALAVACLIAAAPSATLAQPNPAIGTWVLNVTKSKYDPGPAPKSNTVTYAAAGQGLTLSSKGVNAEGKPTAVHYTANFDGKDYPVTGSPDYDAVVLKKTGISTWEATRKKGGAVVQTARYLVSPDGKTMTISASGTNAAGQKFNNVTVLDKK